MRLRIPILAVCICLSATTYCQNLLFDHLKVENGLSQSSVHSIYQDEFNRIWIATRDGLNKYDGNKIEVFRPAVGDTTTLFGSNVQSVCGDRKGHLYIQCLLGLLVYDLRKEKMTTITKDNIYAISYGKDRLWVAENNQIKYLGTDGKLIPYLEMEKGLRITCIRESSEGILYIGTRSQGVFAVDENKKINRILPDIDVVCIYEDVYGNCWIGSIHNGMYRMDRKNTITNYIHRYNDKNSISDNYVRSICCDNQGYYWIGTFKGLDRFSPETMEFSHFYSSEYDSYSIGSSSVWCITKDEQGTLWIGTFFGGVDYINPEFSFNRYYRVGEDGKGLSGSVVGNITEDKKGNLWICTENGGLNYFDREKNRFDSWQNNPEDPQSISSNILKSIYLDEKSNLLWVGTHMGGLNCFNPQTRKFKRYLHNMNNRLSNEYIRCIVPYDKYLLLGTHSSIDVFNPATGTSEPLVDKNKYGLQNKQIWDMCIDSREQLWFSTSTAVYRYDFKTKDLQVYINHPKDSTSIGFGFLNTFFEDGKGRMWVGSAGSGLALYQPRTNSFIHYHTQNSQLIDDYILDINESPMGYLLIATNKGLSRFDVENNVFYNYKNNNFFPFSSINERSLFITQKGEIVICSINGMVIINERDLNVKPIDYKVNLTDLYVNNNLVRPGDKNDILRVALPYTNSISLDYSHSVISIEFASTNYIKAINPQIQYKLEGFDNEWINAENRNTVTYTNLEPGEYIFRLRAFTNSFDQFTPETLLNIKVSPPFYKTTGAYVMYFVILSVLFYILFSNYISRVKLQSSLIYVNKEKKQIEELNQSKLRFFTNISHEFRTPITLMLAQLELLLQNGNLPQNIYNRLISVMRNAEKMKRLINELLDFRKQEMGFVQLKMSKQNIVSFINNIYVPFKEYSYSKHINLLFVHKDESIDVWFDVDQMEKVFFNLLSNAFKFTPPNGEVSIVIEKDMNFVFISVIDTGCGIGTDSLEKVFERFFQEKENDFSPLNLGTGVGLALAKSIVEAHKGKIIVRSLVDKGSTFKVSLPLGDSHFEESLKIIPPDKEGLLYSDINIPEPEFISEIKDSQKEISLQSATILIVEDNQELLQLLVRIFESIYKVYTASDGSEGLEKTIEFQPDIVLSDVMMPKTSGIEMCRKIKTHLSTCHIPVVLLTAKTTEEHAIEGLLTGADDYITKPFNSKILIARCNNLVNGRAAIQKKFSKDPNMETHLLAMTVYDQKLLEKAIRVVEKNMNNPQFDIYLFSSEMGLGRTNLYVKIKGITGQTPNDFIMNIRLKKSLSLLKENPRTSISDIAIQSGFNEPAYFIKRFKKLYGQTPLQYRKSNQ
ncbi:MAG: response regulator [Dysgonamonadaceae bacterium]|jgi:signal transduction histidine kinase/ligand-binding sensor domain-containing protein/DNA-binding response OmpR family regulator|nr:response regulator [Dysgonamonadaceae bacterium]